MNKYKVKFNMIKKESLLTLIKARRTTYQFLNKHVNEIALESCLEAAIWAPNHKLTEPWRFWIIGEKTQQQLAQVYARNRASKNHSIGSNLYEALYQKALIKFNKIPKIVIVGQQLAESEKSQKEDYAACSCAIQNFKLMAWQQSIGVQWSTGPIIEDAETYHLLGIDSHKIMLIAGLYLGYLDERNLGNSNAKRQSLDSLCIKTK